mgnify:CR=1 FL=1
MKKTWGNERTCVLLMLRLFKTLLRVSNWTRTLHSIKQHGTYHSSPIKYIALANYDGSNSSCLFSFCGQIWLKKSEEKRLNSPCNRLDEEQLVVVSIFKCWSKNVHDDDDDHHHHQEARSMSYSSSFVSLTITFYASGILFTIERKSCSTIITPDPFPVQHRVVLNIEKFSFSLVSNCPPLNGHISSPEGRHTQCDLHLFFSTT